MAPILKYGATLGAFSTTFYFSYSGAEVQKMTLGDLFDNPIIYKQEGSGSDQTIDNTSLNRLVCLITDGKKQSSQCSKDSNDSGKKQIGKYSYMSLYPEVKQIFENSWKTNDTEGGLEESKLYPSLEKWCTGKRGEYVTTIDKKLMWHMIMFCSADNKPFKRNPT